MYKDTEISYKGFTLDAYVSRIDKKWVCDYWKDGFDGGSIRGDRRKDVILSAKEAISNLIKGAKDG